MRFCAVLLLLACSHSTRASADHLLAPDSEVAVLLRWDRPPSSISARALLDELRRVMLRARVEVNFFTTNRLNIDVPRLVMFQMHGYCGMDGPPLESGNGKPLGSTFTSDGHLLSFARIDCDEIRASLVRAIGSGDPQRHQILYGRAVAKVMVHELYHMLSQSAEHTETGITRSALSASDLSNPALTLSDEAKDAIEYRVAR